MRRPLGSLLAPGLPVLLPAALAAVLVVAGCAAERHPGLQPGDATGSDPTTSSTPSVEPSDEPDPGSQSDGDAAEPVDHEVVALPHATAVGGTVSPMLVRVETPDELDTFVSQFRRDELTDEIRTIARTASYDGALWAAVVSLGCDVPPGVNVAEGEAGYLVTPQKVVDPLDNCLAPVTTVALVAIR